MRNTEGFVISGISANLFLVIDDQLLTPRMDRCGVHGVLRGQLLREHAGRCERRRIPPDFLDEADEVFFCSAIRGIVPIRAIDDRNWSIGPVTRQMQNWHQELAGRS
jgi:4-amino-4-deoxychorismate lyase